MIQEFLVVLAWLIGGCALLHATGFRGWMLAPFGFYAGLAIHVLVGSILLMAGARQAHLIGLGLTLFLPMLWWVLATSRRGEILISMRMIMFWLLVLLVIVGISFSTNLVKWHSDSFRYLMMGSLIAKDGFRFITPELLSQRMIALPLLHAPAALAGDIYLRSLTPLIGGSTLGMLGWFAWRGLRDKLPSAVALLLSVCAVLALATANRFVWNSFYINGHLLMAAAMLVFAGCGWLIFRHEVGDRALFALQLLSIPLMVFSRPEGVLVAGVLLVPAVACWRASPGRTASLLFMLGGCALAVNLYQAGVYHSYGEAVPFFIKGFLALSVCALIAPAVFRVRATHAILPCTPVVAEAALCIALVAFAFVQSAIFLPSLDATIQNLALDGASWGVFFLMILAVTVLVLVVTRDPSREYLRFPVTTFFPLMFVLAHLREGAYRVGEGDSLNRMLIHIIPLAILLIVVSAGAQIRPFFRRWIAGPSDEVDHSNPVLQ